MEVVGVRALKQNASAVVAAVAAGSPVTVTDRGRPVAQIIPIARGPLARLRAAGLTRPPRTSLAELGPPPQARNGTSLSSALSEQRSAERF